MAFEPKTQKAYGINRSRFLPFLGVFAWADLPYKVKFTKMEWLQPVIGVAAMIGIVLGVGALGYRDAEAVKFTLIGWAVLFFVSVVIYNWLGFSDVEQFRP